MELVPITAAVVFILSAIVLGIKSFTKWRESRHRNKVIDGRIQAINRMDEVGRPVAASRREAGIR